MSTTADPQFPNLDAILEEPVDTRAQVTQTYFATKSREFQELVDALDQTDRDLALLIETLGSDDGSSAMREALQEARDDLAVRKSQIRLVAEAINFVVHGLGPLGVDLPKIRLPATLGAFPLAIAGAAAAAVAAAAALITWGVTWIQGVNSRLQNAQLLEGLSPEQRAAVVLAMQRTAEAQALAQESPLQSIAGVAKWVAIGAIAFFAYRVFQEYQ